MAAQIKLKLQGLLTELESELRTLGWWEQQAPNAQALQSQEPFCIDTLEFAQWLQWVFVPRLRAILNAGHALPSQCAIYEAAEVIYQQQLGQVTGLLECLKTIDQAISSPQQSFR